MGGLELVGLRGITPPTAESLGFEVFMLGAMVLGESNIVLPYKPVPVGLIVGGVGGCEVGNGGGGVQMYVGGEVFFSFPLVELAWLCTILWLRWLW